MFTHTELSDILASATTAAARLVEYRHATQAVVVRLSDDMAQALGAPNGYRRITPFLHTVCEAISSKLEINDQALKASKVKDTKQIAAWLGDNQWALIERELYYKASRDGTAYVLVRWIEDGPRYTVRELFDGSTGAGSVYQNGALAFTFNGWKNGEYFYLDLYRPASIEKYRRKAEGQWEPRQDVPDEEWPVRWTDDDGQPFGIALVEYALGQSDIDAATQLGRDLNEALLDLIATSRTQGWPQRFLSGQRNPNILLNEEGQPLVSPLTGRPFPRTISTAPGSVLLIGAEAKFDQLDGAMPNSTTIDKLLELLSLVTAVPTHYLP